MIAYGRLIDTRVEMSTVGETNNAQFFSEPATIQALPESMVDLQQTLSAAAKETDLLDRHVWGERCLW
jgi:hypothetical protein